MVKVRFADPQPGVFPVGHVLFVDGYADVDESLLREYERLGLAIVPCDADSTDESDEESEPAGEQAAPQKRGRGRPRKSPET